MATKSSTVSNSTKSKANKTSNTLVNLPNSVRRSKAYKPNEKILLNHLVGLYYEWGGNPSFFTTNDEIMNATGLTESTFQRAKRSLKGRKIITLTPGCNKVATVYTIDPNLIKEWTEEKKRAEIKASQASDHVVNSDKSDNVEKMEVNNQLINSLHVVNSDKSDNVDKNTMKNADNTQNTNELHVVKTEKNDNVEKTDDNIQEDKDLHVVKSRCQTETPDDNKNDNMGRSNHEMLVEIRSIILEMRTQLNEVIERMDKNDSKLTDYTNKTDAMLTTLSTVVIPRCQNSTQVDNPITSIYTSSSISTKTTNTETTKQDVELRSSRVAHAQEAGVGVGCCDGGKEQTPSAMPTTHDTNDGTSVGCGVGLDGNKNTNTSTPEEQAQAMEQFNTINANIDNVVGWWQHTQDTPTAQSSLKTLCNELRAIRPQLPAQTWDWVKNKINSIRMTMAKAPTQTPQQINQRRNQLVSECFAKMDSIVENWHSDGRENKNQIADVAIGQLLKYFYSINPTEKQMETINRKTKDYYINLRGFECVPPLERLLTAMTPAKTTQRLSELILKRSDAQMINSSAEWVKARQNASESVVERISDDVVNQTLDGLVGLVQNAENAQRQFPNEATRMFEQAKSEIRAILAESDKWSPFGKSINREIIAPIIAFETKKTDDASVLACLTEIALNCDVKYIQEDVLTVIYAALRYNLSDAIRGNIIKMRFDVENKINGVGEFAPKDEKTTEKPTAESTTDEDEDDMPF